MMTHLGEMNCFYKERTKEESHLFGKLVKAGVRRLKVDIIALKKSIKHMVGLLNQKK